MAMQVFHANKESHTLEIEKDVGKTSGKENNKTSLSTQRRFLGRALCETRG